MIKTTRQFSGALCQNLECCVSILEVDAFFQLCMPSFKIRCWSAIWRFLPHYLECSRSLWVSRRIFMRVQELANPNPVRAVTTHVLDKPVAIHGVQQFKHRATK